MENFLTANKFKFVLTSGRFKDNLFEPMIQSVNIPGLQLGIWSQGTSIIPIERPGDSVIFNDLNISFILREDMEDWKTILQWLQDMRDFKENNFEEIFSDGSLVLLTNKNNTNLIINFEDLWPYNLTDIFFNNESTEPLTCEVSFKYKKFTISNA
jgi:hypothetical protein